MNFLIKTVKIFLLIIFVFFIYKSYTTENFLFLDSHKKTSSEVEDILNDLDYNNKNNEEENTKEQKEEQNFNRTIKQEVAKIKRNNFNTVKLAKIKSKVEVPIATEKEKYFNYHVYGLFLNFFSSSVNNSAGNEISKLHKQTRNLENINILLLVFAFSCLLIWINLEFGILPAIFSGIAIFLNPYYFVLSKSLFVNLWGIILPSSLLGVLLSIERIKKTYIQRQILIAIFATILLKLLLSYRNMWFSMFTVLLVIFYHSQYYMWEKKFSYKRAMTFFKVMIASFLFTVSVEVSINIFAVDSSFNDAINHTLNGVFIIGGMKGVGFWQRLITILGNTKIYFHITGLQSFIFFIIISSVSYWFYNIKLRVHNRQFYYLFAMTLISFFMAVVSSYIEVPSSLYVAMTWIYPATILSFANLGLLIKIAFLFHRRKLVVAKAQDGETEN